MFFHNILSNINLFFILNITINPYTTYVQLDLTLYLCNKNCNQLCYINVWRIILLKM